MQPTRHHGSCLCGAVKFEVDGPLPRPDACHCVQCRKWSGHYFVSSDVPRQRFHLTEQEQLQWYQASDTVRRGFCGRCGSSLFWEAPDLPWIGVAMGALDQPSQTTIAVHIFTAEKGDYYAIEPGPPQFLTVPRR